MEVRAFLALNVPFIILFYLAVLLFIRPPRSVVLASLLGGLITGSINLLVDIIAYYAHWWHYALNDLVLHVPLPFYISPLLLYGSIAYLLIWRFWRGRLHWLALTFLIGTPVLGILKDLYAGGITNTGYAVWESSLAWPVAILMWLVMFFVGFLLFWRLAPPREEIEEQPAHTTRSEPTP